MKSLRNSRSGLTVIEVLTSIVVALIGVAGVMIMIPFAVSQAETGFDQETAYRMGANFADEFEIKGFADTNQWTFPMADPPVGVRTARNYVIDPIGVTDRLINGWGTDQGRFPFVSPVVEALVPPAPVTADQTIFIERVNLNNVNNLIASSGNEAGRSLANHHMTWRDDLVSLEPTNPSPGYAIPDLAPPRQLYDSDGTNPVRRQAYGEMSVMTFVVPSEIIQQNTVPPGTFNYPANPNTEAIDRVREYRNYFVVSKTRPRGNPSASATQPYDRIYQVDHPYSAGATYDPTTPVGNWRLKMAFGGGTLRFRDNVDSLNISNAASTQRAEIRRGDWICLTNVTYNYNVNRFVQQINFYVVSDAVIPDGTDYWQVTLDGPDFDFGLHYMAPGTPPFNPQDYGTFPSFAAFYDPATGETRPSKTYAVHLPDVWAVFEKTYRTAD